MPRKPRKQSSLCINHIILRGINQQIIFEDSYDFLQFISILKHYKEICKFKLYAYCLMDNHIHLLMEHSSDDFAVIMKKIEVKFVRWYNHKYNRIGNLFQDRYKSEPINNICYFQTVLRYIHQNPLHAGLETRLGTYRWSSYNDYVYSDSSLVDIDMPLSLFENHLNCLEFLNTESQDKCLEHYSSYRIPDTEALKLIRQKTNCESPSDFQHLELFTRNQYLKQLFQYGLSIRQLSRLTGISRTSITSAVK